jgi:cytochrome d ubiquinol oxidase subunit I
MSSLTAARIQMELSLGFHMIFAAIGMAMPVMMIIAERRWMRQHDPDARALAHTSSCSPGGRRPSGRISSVRTSRWLHPPHPDPPCH